ncbi:chemotaxis response regulator protein-glutamate methylesterase [bacterium]|nr:MAG: chemotaxis response regulator protein-glutamate methylesterase [bacterium]
MRRIIRQMIESDPDIEVIGAARDGREGVDMAMALKPDVITMDIEMPRMDGMEATAIIMDRLPTPIIIISSLSIDEARATLDALDKGAADYIAKNLVNTALDVVKIQDELVSKIKAVARRKHKYVRPEGRHEALQLVERRDGFATQKIAVVAIGASTGGPRAVQEVLSRLPADLPTSFIVVVHMPKAFTGAFAERLDGICPLKVKEAEDGETIKHGHVFVAQGGTQTRVVKKGVTDFSVVISDEPLLSIYKPCVDITFGSVADAYPGRSMGVILTGMGHDGMEGMRLIKEKGGKTIAQNEQTCIIYGMPKAVIDAGLADKVAPLENIAGEIVNMI